MFTLGDRINERSSKQGGVSVDKVDDILGTHLPVKRRHLIFGQHLVDEMLDMTSGAFMKQLEPLVPQTVWDKANNLAKEKFVEVAVTTVGGFTCENGRTVGSTSIPTR